MKLKPNQFYLPSGQLITEHPILFQKEMVQANLENRKNQTRRTVKDEFLREWLASFPLSKNLLNKHCPYGKPGDLLYVRETFIKSEYATDLYYYKTDGGVSGKWKQSIHLPKSGSRIWAMVEDIRVERVKDISEEDAKAEGIEPTKKDSRTGLQYFKNYLDSTLSNPVQSFQSLWASINGRASWDANPWVWVIKYRILSKTGRPSMEVIEKNYLELMEKEVTNA